MSCAYSRSSPARVSCPKNGCAVCRDACCVCVAHCFRFLDGCFWLSQGGKTPMVPISAKKGMGIDELLETLCLVSEASRPVVSRQQDFQSESAV